MTGYGSAAVETEQFSITVEVKALNSKFLDLALRLPRALNDREPEVRQLVAQRLERGKIALIVDIQDKSANRGKVQINQALLREYYETIRTAAAELGASTEGLFTKVLDMPDILQAAEDVPETLTVDWDVIRGALETALDKCLQFRTDEGVVLQESLRGNVEHIGGLLLQVEQQDPRRVAAVRERLRDKVRELIPEEHVDDSRFEQEILYYLEKLDINEEKVRLRAHLGYFLEVLKQPGHSGKKLHFIAQEIGREINTIGSKANDAQIQRFVVDMKEELEKIKEQSMNVL
ncbi:TIGR00255 family protein [Catalinimonas alkaloidigena]|uniref:TIGR00255 family protein n=2 Tax=Catalinimonas alkaloidigena TaxID=1075417 RepID=A0A1G9M2C1_9BACT|nr:TIGR00255 family protein [Catalinimonas alkaloidigena]